HFTPVPHSRPLPRTRRRARPRVRDQPHAASPATEPRTARVTFAPGLVPTLTAGGGFTVCAPRRPTGACATPGGPARRRQPRPDRARGVQGSCNCAHSIRRGTAPAPPAQHPGLRLRPANPDSGAPTGDPPPANSGRRPLPSLLPPEPDLIEPLLRPLRQDAAPRAVQLQHLPVRLRRLVEAPERVEDLTAVEPRLVLDGDRLAQLQDEGQALQRIRQRAALVRLLRQLVRTVPGVPARLAPACAPRRPLAVRQEV